MRADTQMQLWFDVERRYKTMERGFSSPKNSCGLM